MLLCYLPLRWMPLSYMVSQQEKEMEIIPAKHLFLWKLVVLCWWYSGSSLHRPVSQTLSAPVPTAAAAAPCGAVLPTPPPVGCPKGHCLPCGLYLVPCTQSHEILIVFIKTFFFLMLSGIDSLLSVTRAVKFRCCEATVRRFIWAC